MIVEKNDGDTKFKLWDLIFKFQLQNYKNRK